ncbi:MAG: class I SAM-dependent methyltransferase [Saprospiraceae bacterium]|nr:class I SAM-dependent methyltransferase [Saprospiraceae bacterium]
METSTFETRSKLDKKLMNWRWKIAQSAEIRWWQHYLHNKDETQYLAAKKTYWHRFLNALQIDIQANEQILDAGCGPAGIFMIFNENLVDAIDPLIDQYEYLRHFNKNDYPNVRFYKKSLESIEYQKKYDIIFCLNAINHVADLEKSLDNLIKILATNGRLIMSIDVHKNNFLKRIFRLIPGDILHPHQHSLTDYLQMLEHRGCKIEKTICLKTGQIFNYVAIVVTIQ